jgi:NTE family protein
VTTAISDEQLARLSRIPIFAPLKKAELARVLKDSREVSLEKGAIVFSAGEPADGMYVVLSGHVEAWGGGLQGGLVGEFRDGDFFGEMALVLDEPRTATLQCAADSRLLVVSRETFARTLESNPRVHAYLEEVRLARRADTIGRNPLCSLLDPRVREELAPRFEEEVRERGDVVFSAGDPADAFYLVLSGELEVWGGEGGSQLIGHLGPPSSFGEQALLLHQARVATIRVAERARLLVLGRELFERTFADNPRVMEYLEDIREDRGLQLMEQVPLFSFLDAAERRVLRAQLKDVSFEQGDVVCEAGEEGDAFYVVRSGELEVWGGAHGRELLDTIGPSGCFGEDSLVLGAPRNATVKAAGPVRLLALERHAFERFFLRKPKAVAYLTEARRRRRAAAFNQISLFKLVDPDALEDVRDEFVEQTFRKGEAVCRAGESSTTFYVVLNGALDVWSAAEPPAKLARLGAGDFFGELAVILGEKRAATVVAAQRSQLLGLPKDAFTRLFLRNPRSLEYFSRVMCQRLSSTITGESVGTGELDITVDGQPGAVGKSLVAATLAALLREITRAPVLLLRLGAADPNERLPGLHLHLAGIAHSFEVVRGGLLEHAHAHGPVELTVGFEKDASADRLGGQLSELVSRLGDDFKYKVFDMAGGAPALSAAAQEFADVRVEIVARAEPEFPVARARPGTQAARYTVVNLHDPQSRRIAVSACAPFVIPEQPGLDAESVLAHPRSPAALPLWRLARKILGRSVGLVLGGGAAFGLSHLGVLQVLEKNSVPVDLVVGCSIGSMIAISYAAGFGVERMIEKAHEMGGRGYLVTGLDFTLFRPGIIAGERLKSRFSPLLCNKETFEDLVLPCRTVATDIRTGELVAIGRGRLEDAYRASIAVPLVISPEQQGGRVLVDGGVADPVPAETARQMGADLVIAVPVVPRLKKGVETVISKWFGRLNAFNPFAFGRGEEMPNSLDITMNSLQTLQHELGVYKVISADVTIQPELADFTWTDFDRSRELVERGATAAEAALPALRKALSL